MERYVVTGIGVYNGLGSSAERSWTNLLAGKSAVARLSWPEDDSTRFPVSHSIIKTPIAALSDDLTDDDGVFCIPSVNTEPAGAERLRDYLQQVFAGEWNNQTIIQLLQKEGAKSSNLEEWLRDEFFIQHCKVFQIKININSKS